MKWSDIILNEEGKMSYAKIVDLKMTHSNNNFSKNDISRKVVINSELQELLVLLGYNKKKGTSEYIVANEENCSRENMSLILSSAFNMLYKKLELPYEKKFKHLRKTYITGCYIKNADKTLAPMGNKNITPKYYFDMSSILEALRKSFNNSKD